MEARALCEILKCIIIHWKREVAGVSREALLEGELFISIEDSSSKHRADPFHYVTTIAFVGSVCDDLVSKQFLKEVQSLLSGFSGKLTWPSEEADCAQDLAGLASFQMKFEVDEKPTTWMTDCLVIKQFLHKTSVVHPKVSFHFGVKVNGVLSKETFGGEKEPIVKLKNGIGLLTNRLHYMRPGIPVAHQVCSRIHPVLGHPVALFIPDDEASMGLLGQLTLTPTAALCPCCKLHPNQTSRISPLYVFLYGPSGLPLIFPNQEHPLTVFDDNSYLFDWKKYHLCAAPNLNISLEEDLVLPDVSYWIESHERSQPQDLKEQVLLLFLMVDFHSGFPAQLTEAWGMQSLLLTHLNSILLENQSLVQGAVQMAVDQALGQHHQVVKAQQKLQASIPVAVSSILSIVAGSTNGSFRTLCLQALQAADTQQLRRGLHQAFQRTLPRRLLHHSACDPKRLLPEPPSTEREDGDERLEESLPESTCPGEAPRPKRHCHGGGGVSPAEATQRPLGPGPLCSQARGSRGEVTGLWGGEVKVGAPGSWGEGAGRPGQSPSPRQPARPASSS
ncbi:type 2 DNA topoisomerase 6 subunit B-like [Petaurus breviceps papuanus]|uniref:type 2 DNA topoisomerase 6 subunit B-like n=1 Tax=Petaurus breviceps papuanus TaxID=3040969 RepID=UPI0036DF95BC